MSNLNGRQFGVYNRDWFHNSKANLTPGVDQILPSNDPRVGGSHYGYSRHDIGGGGWSGDPNRGDKTFAADTENEAEAWEPNGYGRPVTYVVRPPSDALTEIETQHYVTSKVGEPRGEHLKTTGPMNIIDRIDIPRPRDDDEVVQGTLPPQNWGHFNRLPEGYTGPATSGEQRRDDNHKRFSSLGQRQRADQEDWERHRTRDTERYLYEEAWREAGQQRLLP